MSVKEGGGGMKSRIKKRWGQQERFRVYRWLNEQRGRKRGVSDRANKRLTQAAPLALVAGFCGPAMRKLG